MGDLERKVLLRAANAGLVEPSILGLSGLPRSDDLLSSPSSGSEGWVPIAGRCIDGRPCMSASSSSSYSSGWSYVALKSKRSRSSCLVGRNSSLMVEGKDDRRKGLREPGEGLGAR